MTKDVYKIIFYMTCDLV